MASTWSSDGEEWKKRQIAEISSIAMPLLLRFHARIAHSTKCLADSVLSAVEHTISTASWLEITSHTYNYITPVPHAQTMSDISTLLICFIWMNTYNNFKEKSVWYTPSVANTTNWSLLLMFLCVTSGTEIRPYSLMQ